MTEREITVNPAWVPSACTLPDAERPLRVAEFDGFFAQAVRTLDRPLPTRLRLGLDAGPAIAVRAAELAARESGCCSFFAFALTITGEGTTLEVEVPEGRAAVLDALHTAAQGRIR
ncbi:hypothetical protein [Actinocorallia populi]|uniref:hypothetical protein n=1 Tax=Actinocorallia populi TaxID=2079200 RepID=UPI000D08E9AE|nr:hypothetical protein [Actinocorallia populi]